MNLNGPPEIEGKGITNEVIKCGAPVTQTDLSNSKVMKD